MRSSRWSRGVLRTARFELCEPRLVLSSRPVPALQLEYFPEDQAFAEIGPAWADARELSGWSEARSAYGLTGEGQTVAIIDTGIAYTHTALAGRVVGGYDFAERDADPYDDGPWGAHGTHVAGIVASGDAAAPGVAPDVQLVALRVFDDAGQGRFGWLEQALRWVHEHRNDYDYPITTVNMSLGTDWNGDTPPPWAMLEDELAQLAADGIVVTAAAGNGFTTCQAPGLTYPAASPYVIAVSSVDPDGRLSYFSQRHQRALAAPGRSINSSVPDYLGDQNGVDDDFARFSGTSMAAPYLAGATVLVRQAYQFAGVSAVNSQLVYNVLRDTADAVYDPATGATYRRLNLQAALEAIMPADDYGSGPQTAHALGTVADTLTVEGTIGRLDDVDFFQFTAARTGQIILSAATTDRLVPRWQLVGASPQPATGPADQAELRLPVVAGQTYIVGLGTAEGIGHYRLDLQLVPAAAPGESEGQYELPNQRISPSGRWLSLTATRTGIFTVEAAFSHAAGDVDMELFDSGGQRLAGSYSASDGERIDVAAVAGQSFILHVYTAGDGTNEDVDIRVTNLVSRSGSTVNVTGTGGEDRFSFVAGAEHQLTVNGTTYQFDPSQVRSISLDGLDGTDRAVLTAGADDNTVWIQPGQAELAGEGYRLQVSGMESLVVVGRGGADRAFLYDSPGDDVLHATPHQTTLSAAGHTARVVGFAQVHAFARNGGFDVARLIDSRGDDRFVATARGAKMFGAGYLNRVRYFDAVHALARSGGFDVARLYDSPADDRFVARPGNARMVSPSSVVRTRFFEAVTGWAKYGGFDTAEFHGGGPGQRWYQGPTGAALVADGYLQRAKAFEEIQLVGGAEPPVPAGRDAHPGAVAALPETGPQVLAATAWTARPGTTPAHPAGEDDAGRLQAIDLVMAQL